MDSIFTIPYSEYAVADKLSKSIKKKKVNVSVMIPASRQEKGIDLVLYSYDEANKINRFLTVQVKSSRTYFEDKKILVDDISKQIIGGLWFRRFEVQNNADWFILTGICIKHPSSIKKTKIKDTKWDNIMLAFNKDEMKSLIDNVKLKKDPEKDDNFFILNYDESGKVYQVRGCPQNTDVTQYLLKNRVDEIIKDLT